MRFATALAVVATFLAPAALAQDAYQAALRGGNEVPPVQTDAYGVAKVFVEGTTVTVSGSFADLSSEYLFSHIHRGLPTENGPVALALTAGLSADKTEGSWEFADNTFTVSQALADSIAAGLAYVNVHSQDNPGGEIRGTIVSSARTADVLITGVFDGPLPNGLPKAVELYVASDVSDLSRYGLGTANNGGGTDGAEFVFPAQAATAGTTLTITTNTDAFAAYFGQAATFVDGAVEINGDDAVELFYDADDDDDFARAEVVDVFGEVSVDGSGQPWEYADGWAYRRSGTGVGGDIFTLDDWTFSGIDANDDQTTNAGAPSPFPFGSFSTDVTAPTARLQVIHNSPDPAADTVDVYVNDALFLDDVPFRGASAFTDVPAGVALKVDVTANDAVDNAAPVFTGTYTLDASSTVQLIATGVVGTGFAANPDGVDTAFTLLVAPDAQEAASAAGEVDIRVVHGAPDAPTVDVAAQDSDISPGSVTVTYSDVTGYLAHDPISYVINVNPTDDPTTVFSYAADLSGAAGTAVTVLASGFLTPADDNNGPAFELLLVNPDGTTAVLLIAVANEASAFAAGMDLRVANPIASASVVTFDAGVAGRVELAVFDALGRRVASLADETVAPGARSVSIDASALAPGVYVLRLVGEAGTITRTVTVVR